MVAPEASGVGVAWFEIARTCRDVRFRRFSGNPKSLKNKLQSPYFSLAFLEGTALNYPGTKSEAIRRFELRENGGFSSNVAIRFGLFGFRAKMSPG